jgi:NodT family efflux transporter outer membrane factor (OMF) lipoprotein
MNAFRQFRGLASVAMTATLLLSTGCVVGPNFKKPDAPQIPNYTPTPITETSSTPKVSGGEAQSFATARDIPGDWWTMFHSKPLNDLIERSLKANPDLKSAQAALLVARENTLAQRGYYYPYVSAGFSATRARTSSEVSPFTASGQLTYGLFTPQVNVSYTPDVFGLNRRTVESLKAQEEQARYALVATHITLSSNVAAGAVQEASLRGQIDVTNELIRINTQMLQILRSQYARGYATELDVAGQEAQLAQVAATLPPLLKQLAQQRDQLAVLAGGFSQPGDDRNFFAREPATPPGAAAYAAITARRTAPRCAPGRGESALCECLDRSGARQPVAQLSLDGGCREHGAFLHPVSHIRRILGHRCSRDAAGL